MNLANLQGEVSNDFRFLVDADHAGNTEVENRRRSQNGAVTLVGDAAVDWYSKVSSVAFATPLVGEAHADFSSGASEIYATGNATCHFLDLSYLYEEAGMSFPIPFELQMDNTTFVLGNPVVDQNYSNAEIFLCLSF